MWPSIPLLSLWKDLAHASAGCPENKVSENLKSAVSYQSPRKSRVEKGLSQRYLWLWLLSKGENACRDHKRPTQFLKEFYRQKHFLLTTRDRNSSTEKRPLGPRNSSLFKDFIHLFIRDRERERQREKQAP